MKVIPKREPRDATRHRDARPISLSRRCPTVVVGLGNDLLSDDGVGIHVARRLRERLNADRYEVLELSVGGLALVDQVLGYREAIVIDACRTGCHPPGTVTRHRPEEFASSLRLASYHAMDFPTALELARQVGADLPDQIVVFAVEVEDIETIHEGCTPRVEAGIETAVEAIACALEREGWQ